MFHCFSNASDFSLTGLFNPVYQRKQCSFLKLDKLHQLGAKANIYLGIKGGILEESTSGEQVLMNLFCLPNMSEIKISSRILMLVPHSPVSWAQD